MNENEGRIGPLGPESRFSRADHLCPHPEYWTSTDDHSTEVEVSDMLAGLVRGLQPDYVVETGSAWGQTAQMIGEALEANGHGRLDSIEPDPERVEYSSNRCSRLPMVRFHQQESLQFTPTEEIQFAFFDSLFPLRVPEFMRYRPWMRPGTIVAFHDSKSGHGGGQFASGRDLRGEIEAELPRQIRFIHLPTPRGITIGEVL